MCVRLGRDVCSGPGQTSGRRPTGIRRAGNTKGLNITSLVNLPWGRDEKKKNSFSRDYITYCMTSTVATVLMGSGGCQSTLTYSGV